MHSTVTVQVMVDEVVVCFFVVVVFFLVVDCAVEDLFFVGFLLVDVVSVFFAEALVVLEFEAFFVLAELFVVNLLLSVLFLLDSLLCVVSSAFITDVLSFVSDVVSAFIVD